jgi:hypothetical protein
MKFISYKVSFFDKYKVKDTAKYMRYVSLIDIFADIKAGTYLNIVSKLRFTRRLQGKEAYKQLREKMTIPTYTPSAVCAGIKVVVRRTMIIALDIDHTISEEQKQRIIQSDYTLCMHKSISGFGYVVYYKYEGQHIDVFNYLEGYYKKFGIEVDAACKNINRLRYISYDKDLYYNLDSKVLKVVRTHREPTTRKQSINTSATYTNDDKIYNCLEQIHKRRIDVTQGVNWVRIGRALVNTYNELGRDIFHQFSQYHYKYSTHETDQKYNTFLRSDCTGYTIGAIFQICKEHQIYYTKKLQK